MPQNYRVKYSTDNMNYTTLSNVQSIAISVGRQRQLDAYNASTATITVRYPTGYASPITAMTSGNFIVIENVTSSQFMFAGVINNVDVAYGIPYSGGVGNDDYLTLTVEGSFSRFGRVQGQSYAMAADTLYNQLQACATSTGLNIQTLNTNTQPLAATTVSGTWGDWVNSVLVTINGRVWDSQAAGVTTVRTPFNVATSPITFSDTTNNSTNQVYDQINFGSYADNYYTQVTVDSESYAPATVSTGSAPYRTLAVNTFNSSVSQATDYANYLLNNFNTKGFALLSISCLAEAQTTFKLDAVSGETANQLCTIPGTRVSVVFRGTTYNCVIEGCSVTATPESSRYTFYLSGADLNSYLILNDSVFGRLDYNKLGY